MSGTDSADDLTIVVVLRVAMNQLSCEGVVCVERSTDAAWQRIKMVGLPAIFCGRVQAFKVLPIATHVDASSMSEARKGSHPRRCIVELTRTQVELLSLYALGLTSLRRMGRSRKLIGFQCDVKNSVGRVKCRCR